ncbi:divergent PAP2 family protein [archaeon]|jgi:uncharacterized protein|nr:divergent PAP2 family protein [archaeon]MBT6824291.1 divergent PAP2 family protein [archaeon]MBT7107369.1 divergent PAP2 family protein [archaeon]MBT7297335.1 divergent PAP2 family protein [archaeon]
MEIFYKIFIGLILATFIPQTIKTITEIIKTRKLSLSQLFVDGGMPSSHSSFVSALSTAMLLTEKLSMLTLVTIAFSAIVIRDSLGVRLEVEKQKKIFKKLYPNETLVEQLKREGHTTLQVFAGIIFGAIVMLAVLL